MENPFSKIRLIAIILTSLFAVFAMKTLAHDAGMSSLNVEFSNQTLTISSEYSRREIEKIVSLTDEKALTDLVLNAIIVKVDGKFVAVAESKYSFNDGHTFDFQQVFHDINGEKIELQSLLLAKFKPDHSQFLTIWRNDGAKSFSQILSGENDSITIDFEKLEPNTSFTKFLPIGIEHILFGYDHLLFLFALLLMVKNFGGIAKIVTSFTVAHSITLTLATLKVIQISPAIVEPLIALSMVFVGLENLFKSEIKNRWILTYIFGLIHGFGFASALQEIGIGNGISAAVPLVSFNLGVEIGQIAVVLVTLPVLWKLQKGSFYSSRIVPIGSAVVVLAGIYWFIERVLF